MSPSDKKNQDKTGKNNEKNQNFQSYTEIDGKSAEAAMDGGGKQVKTPFNRVSDEELDNTARLKQTIDLWLIAPFRIIWSDWRARSGILITLVFIFMGTIGTHLVPYPKPNSGPPRLKPFENMNYILGTDPKGQGVFAYIVHATPVMFQMIIGGAIFTIIFATAIGIVAGYKGGWTETVLMTITDIMMTIPGLPLIIVVAAIIEPESPVIVGILVSINAWAGLARAIRSQVLTDRDAAYVEASRTIGLGTPSIVTRDILPNLMPYVLVNFVGAARGVIFGSVGLYFLGVLPFSNLNWGVMINRAYNSGALYSDGIRHWLIAPLSAVIFLSLGFILFAQGCDRLFNPRVRARHASTINEENEQEKESSEGPTAIQS